MSNNGHQDILKYFKFVVFFVGRILGKQKNLFNINKLQEIFYPPGDAKNFNRLQQLSFGVTKIGLQFFLRRPSLEEFLF